jgi:hypothetical protein
VIRHNDFPGHRWLGVALRTLHLVGVVLVGGGLLGAGAAFVSGVALMLVSGIALFALDLWRRPDLWKEVAGVFVAVKLAVVAAMPLLPELAVALFWLVLVTSAAVAHAPRVFRHRRLLE